MTIKQQGGIFGRNPTFNDVTSNNVTTEDLYVYHPTTNQIAKFESGDATAQIVVSDNVADVRIKNTAGKMLLEADPNGDGASSYLRFTVDGSTAAEFTASGNLAFPSGQGIDFSATSGTGTSELLDDYEEGTWTPTYNTSNDDLTGVNYYRRYGFYTKIGNVVTVQFHISTGNAASAAGTGFVILEGLPFSINITATSGNAFGANVASDRWSADAPAILVTTTNGSTSLYLAQAIHSNYNVVADFNNIASNNYNVVAGHFTYRV